MNGIVAQIVSNRLKNTSEVRTARWRIRTSPHNMQANGSHHQRRQQLHVVVTGGSAGIGRSIVETFAREGHYVMFTYLSSVSASLELETKFPNNVTKTVLDQGCVTSIATFGRTVKNWCGDNGVDVLVNNAALGSATVKHYVRAFDPPEFQSASNGDDHDDARKQQVNGISKKQKVNGITPNGCNTEKVVEHGSAAGACPVARRKIEQVARQTSSHRAAEDMALMRVNALGPLWVTEALEPVLLNAATSNQGRGRSTCIFIGSVGGGSSAVFPEYRASDLMSKAAMTYLVKHLAAQYVRESIDVVCVAPGATETDMFRQSTLSKVSNVDEFINGMPKQKLIQPQEVADAVLWLATNNAARIFHGAILDASLGLGVRPGLQTETANAR